MAVSASPRVSVVMSVYNGQPFLEEAVESVLGQTFGDFEFIIVNDGSTDGSGEVLDEWASKDSRIRVMHQENRGIPYSLNRGWRMARGAYIARMDADDISRPQRFEKQVEFLEKDPTVDVLGTNVEVIDADGERLQVPSIPTTPGLIAWRTLFGSAIWHPTVMMRKRILQRAGGYDDALPEAHDYDLWTRLTPITDFSNLSDVLLKYRWWGGNISTEYEEAQLADADASAVKLHQYYLGEAATTSKEALQFLRRVESSSKPESKAGSYTIDEISFFFRYILKLYHAFMQKERYSDKDLEAVTRDAIRKLERVASAVRPRSKFKSRLMKARALALMPSEVLEWIRDGLRRRLPI